MENNERKNSNNENDFQKVETYESTEEHSESKLKIAIDPSLKRYPFCIVWTPIPLITYLIPFIGHTGICTSEGIVHDFAGSYFIGIDDMAFGEPHKYVQLELSHTEKQNWDKSISNADKKYDKLEHNLILNNCHSHVACALNNLKYKGKSNYTMISIFLMVTFKRNYVSFGHFIKTYLPFTILVLIILIIRFLIK